MSLIKTVIPEEAEGQIKEVYDQMLKIAGMVPKPLQLMSASPKIFDIGTQSTQYYMQHPTLNPVLLACIRFVSATHCEYPYCIDMNQKMLMVMGGLNEEQVQQLISEPTSIELPDKDKAMLLFVIKAIQTPEDIQKEDLDTVRNMGWSDQDIFEAANHGAFMVAGGLLFNIFKMGI